MTMKKVNAGRCIHSVKDDGLEIEQTGYGDIVALFVQFPFKIL